MSMFDQCINVAILFVDCTRGNELRACIEASNDAYPCEAATKVDGVEFRNRAWDSDVTITWMATGPNGKARVHFQALISLESIKDVLLSPARKWEGYLGLYGPNVELSDYSGAQSFGHSLKMGTLYGSGTPIPVARVRIRYREEEKLEPVDNNLLNAQTMQHPEQQETNCGGAWKAEHSAVGAQQGQPQEFDGPMTKPQQHRLEKWQHEITHAGSSLDTGESPESRTHSCSVLSEASAANANPFPSHGSNGMKMSDARKERFGKSSTSLIQEADRQMQDLMRENVILRQNMEQRDNEIVRLREELRRANEEICRLQERREVHGLYG